MALAGRMSCCFLLQLGRRASVHPKLLRHHHAVVRRRVGGQMGCTMSVLSPARDGRASGAGRLRQAGHQRGCPPARWRVLRDAAEEAVTSQDDCSGSMVLAQPGQDFNEWIGLKASQTETAQHSDRSFAYHKTAQKSKNKSMRVL